MSKETSEKTAQAAAPEQTAQVKAPVTLESLQAAADVTFAAYEAARKDKASTPKQIMDAGLADYKANDAIRKFEAAQMAEKTQAELNAKIEARGKLVDDLLTAHENNLKTQADKKLSVEDRNAANDAFNVLRDNLKTELTKTMPKPTAVRASGENATTNANSAGKGKEIETLYIEKMGGETFLTNRAKHTQALKEIQDLGYSRGTVGAVTLAYRTANGQV